MILLNLQPDAFARWVEAQPERVYARRNNDACPLACYLKDLYTGALTVSVNPYCIQIWRPSETFSRHVDIKLGSHDIRQEFPWVQEFIYRVDGPVLVPFIHGYEVLYHLKAVTS